MVCRGPGRISTGVSTFFTDPKNNLTELEPNLAATICPSDPGAQIRAVNGTPRNFAMETLQEDNNRWVVWLAKILKLPVND